MNSLNERAERLEKLAKNLEKFLEVDQVDEKQVYLFYHYCRSDQVIVDLLEELLEISLKFLGQPVALLDGLLVLGKEQEAAIAKRLLVHPDFPALFEKLYPGMLKSFFSTYTKKEGVNA